MGAQVFDRTCLLPEPYVFNFSLLSTYFLSIGLTFGNMETNLDY
jgi:hypothetical protein